MLLSLPTRPAKAFLWGGALAVNALLVFFIYTLAWGTGSRTEQASIQLATVYYSQQNQPQTSEPERETELSAAQQSSLSPPPPEALKLSSLSVDSAIKIPAIEITPDKTVTELQTFSMEFSPSGKVPGSSMSTNILSAKPIFQLPPQYPLRAKQWGIEGYVILDLAINPQGRVDDIRVVKQEPTGVFLRSAKRAVMRWRFAAPDKTQWQRLTIQYELEK